MIGETSNLADILNNASIHKTQQVSQYVSNSKIRLVTIHFN